MRDNQDEGAGDATSYRETGVSDDSSGDRDQPIDRLLAVIDEVVGLRRSATVTEIAGRLDLPNPTTHRIVRQLVERGLLKRVLGSKRVLVGARLTRMAAEILEAAIVADAPHMVLARLAAELGEHCHVGVMAEEEVLYIDSARPGRSFGLQFEPGRRSPLHCTSSGKIWLAELSEHEFERWLERARLTPLTSQTITDRAALREAVSEVRRKGWAASDEESVEGVIGCAVPIRARTGQLVASLGISVPRVRMEFSSLPALIPRLETAAAEIGELI